MSGGHSLLRGGSIKPRLVQIAYEGEMQETLLDGEVGAKVLKIQLTSLEVKLT